MPNKRLRKNVNFGQISKNIFKAHEHKLYWYTLWYTTNNDHDEIKEYLKYLEHIIDHMHQVMKIFCDLVFKKIAERIHVLF